MAYGQEHIVADALTGDVLSFDSATGSVRVRKGAAAEELGACTSLFFPGCSFINYAMPLVEAVYDTLLGAGEVDGFSPLCCGKILAYEPDGAAMRTAFEQDLRDHLAQTSITRIVAACPNCVKALRELLTVEERTSAIEVVPLPKVFADLGYRLDKAIVARLLTGDESADVLLCPHDSCPDRDTGEFATSMRALMDESLYRDPMHNRNRSICCGSLPRAAGKFEAADRCAMRNLEEAQAVSADAMVTACMSCAFQLNMVQRQMPAVHFLELLYDWRIDWAAADMWMKLRFLFGDTLGVVEEEEEAWPEEAAPCEVVAESGRTFAGLGGGLPTVADEAIDAAGATIDEAERARGREVTISNEETKNIGA